MNVFSVVKKNFQNLNIVCLLASSIVPFLVTGPFIPDLILSSLSIWFLYYCIKKKIFKIFKNKYFLVFIIFWIICVLSSLLSDEILFSLKSSIFYIRIGIFALLISYLIDVNKKILDFFYYAIAITFLILVIDGFFQHFTGYNILGYSKYTIRVSSFFGDEYILGSYLTRLSPLFFALFIVREKKNFESYFFFILLFLVSILIFLSGERAAFFLSILSSVFIIFFISSYKYQRLLIFLISLIVIISILVKDSKFSDRFYHSIVKDMRIENNNFSKILIFTQMHNSLYRTGFKMFLDQPILGHGPKLFRKKCNNIKYSTGVYPCSNHPHNFYIQLLAETGLIGFSFLFGLFIYFIYIVTNHIFRIYKYKEKLFSDYQLCLLAGLLITIWPITSNGNFFSNYLVLTYSLQMGFFKKNLGISVNN
jgi:O-antigen ligase